MARLRLAVIASLALLVARLHAAEGLGFADAEALYVAYAMHPQPAYVDHPGLVGVIVRFVGAGGLPSPERLHTFASVVATLIPWIGALAARASGASWQAATRTVFALAFVPEIAIGLWAMSPHLPLACAWLGAIAATIAALRADPKSFRALWGLLLAGALVGVACLSSASGLLLGLAIFVTLLYRSCWPRWRTAAPWAAFGVAAVLIAPVVVWEAREGFPMLRHRLVATQGEAGPSLRNLGALVGGQLAYVTPPFLFGAYLVLRRLWPERNATAVDRLLFLATVVPAVPLVLICLVSKVAEPHWLAPAYLAVAVHLSRVEVVGRKLGVACVATGALIVGLGWAVVKTPVQLELLGERYRARYDLSNDLYAWAPAGRMLQQLVDEERKRSGRTPVVVGPHYIVCAQAHVTLGPTVPVGCRTPFGDDFRRWLPESTWDRAPTVLFVQDDRFPLDASRELPDRTVRKTQRVLVHRGGRVVRTIRATVLDNDTTA